MWFNRLALLAALLASACGGKTGDAPRAPAEPTSPDDIDPPLPTTTPSVTPPRSTNGAPPDEAPPPLGAETLVPEDIDETVNELILVILAPACGACHGGATSHVPPGDLEFTDDIDRMVELGIIIPLDSGGSPLIQVLRNGSMPPPGVQPRLAAGEVEVLTQFIDNPRFWPTFTGPAFFDAGTSNTTDAGGANAADAGTDGG
jgi:hypothetical protein